LQTGPRPTLPLEGQAPTPLTLRRGSPPLPIGL